MTQVFSRWPSAPMSSPWLQFVWFYKPDQPADSWSISAITVDAAMPILEPSETPTDVETPTLTATPSETATEIFDTPTPTVEITVTPTEWLATLTPTATSTPTALGLPVYASMDDGAIGWIPSGGWFLNEGARFGEAGQGWFASAADSASTLDWQQPLDLRQAAAPQLHFQSALQNQVSVAAVQISLDQVNWQLLATVAPSGIWQETVIDLSAYRGQIVWLQFVWLYVLPGDQQSSDFWMLDAISLVDVIPTPTNTDLLIPTATLPDYVTMTPTATLTEEAATATFTDEPTITPTFTETATWTETPLPTDIPTDIPIDEPSLTQEASN